MLKKGHKRVVIGTGGTNSAFGSLLMPSGDHALVIDRDVYNSALRTADAKFNEIIKQIGLLVPDQILAQYAADVIKEERPRILEDALKGEGWRSFWISFWASAAFAAVLAVIVMVAAISGVGLPIQFNIGAKPPVSTQNSN